MNKLGFYLEVTTVPHLRDAIREVKPPTILIHAGDRGLLRDIRRFLAPDSFVIGRLFVPLQDQQTWLDSNDPEGRGRAFAERILNFDFGLATEVGENGRRLIDAWMSLNETLRGPASFPNFQIDDQFRRRAEAYDRFQVAFRNRLQERGVEAVAFNFAAGNFIQASHYLDWFPRTLESYVYLGFHEYGWPTMYEDPAQGSQTGAGMYRRCLQGIRQQYGDRHRVIITEAGLARMYKYPSDGAGDVGWLYAGETISQDAYWKSLEWYNDYLCCDNYVVGACLFQVGHAGRWQTFRHLGQDNQGQPITIISRIASLKDRPLPECEEEPAPPSDTEPSTGDETPPPDLPAQVMKLKTLLSAAAQQATEISLQMKVVEKTLHNLTRQAEQMAGLHGQIDDALAQLRPLKDQADRPQLQQQARSLEEQLRNLQPQAQQLAQLAAPVTQSHQTLATVVKTSGEIGPLHRQMRAVMDKVREMEQELGIPGDDDPVPQP